MKFQISNILSAGAAVGLQQDYRSIGTSRTAAAVPFGRRRSRAPYDVCRPEKTTSTQVRDCKENKNCIAEKSYTYTKTMNDRNWTSCGSDVGTYILHIITYYI